MKRNLTNAVIQNIKPGPSDVLVWDEKQPGLFLKVTPAGKRSFGCFYRNKQGKQRKPRLGYWPEMTIAEARKEAATVRVEADRDNDISEARQAARKVLTLGQFWEQHYSKHAKAHQRPKTWAENQRRWRLHIKEAIGSRRLDEITVADVKRIHDGLADTPIGANRVVSLIRSLLNLAKQWGLLPDTHSNPAGKSKVPPYKERKKQRFLNAAEWGRLAKALDQAERLQTEPVHAIAAIRLLALTGCRRDEILTLQWWQVDFDRSLINLPDAKAGDRSVQLNQRAVDILRGLEAIEQEQAARGNPNDYVMRGYRHGQRLIGIQRVWHRIRTAAKIPDVRLHDLRHSFASEAIAAGASLYVTGGLLGHRDSRTTQRYAHLSEAQLREVSERVAVNITEAMAGKVIEVEKRTNKTEQAEGGK